MICVDLMDCLPALPMVYFIRNYTKEIPCYAAI